VSAADALDIRSEGDVVVAALMGEIDLANAKPIGSLVAGAIPNDATGLVLDLSAVTYLDSSGVHLIFDLAQRLGDRQQRLVLALPPGSRIRRVLDLVNLDAVVTVEETAEAATASARS
jgi:anti-anti-sigma factor